MTAAIFPLYPNLMIKMQKDIKFTPPQLQNKVKGERYDSLDGLRAYAALGIILMHVLSNIKVRPSANYLTEHLIPFFTDFTLLFMMVSGFSLCCGYYRRMKDGTITPDAFYRKRYLRILPFFALLCFLDLAVSPSLGSLCEVFANMTLCFGLLPPSVDIGVIGVGWFLGVVFLFYMLFPFFVFMLDSRRRAWVSFVLAVTFVLVSIVHFSAPGRKCMVFCAPLFIAGGIVYLYRHELSGFGTSHPRLSALAVAGITAAFFAVRGLVSDAFAGYLLELVLFSSWLAYAVGSKARWLDNRFARYLSGISMEIYLAHMVIYRVIEKAHLEDFIPQGDLLYVVTSLLTIVGAVCFSHVVKRRVLPPVMRRLGQRQM